MKSSAARIFFLFILGLTASATAQSAGGEVTWLSDYDIARAHARDTERPLLVIASPNPLREKLAEGPSLTVIAKESRDCGTCTPKA